MSNGKNNQNYRNFRNWRDTAPLQKWVNPECRMCHNGVLPLQKLFTVLVYDTETPDPAIGDGRLVETSVCPICGRETDQTK